MCIASIAWIFIILNSNLAHFQYYNNAPPLTSYCIFPPCNITPTDKMQPPILEIFWPEQTKVQKFPSQILHLKRRHQGMSALGYSMITLKLTFERVKLPWALSFELMLLVLRYVQRKKYVSRISQMLKPYERLISETWRLCGSLPRPKGSRVGVANYALFLLKPVASCLL